MRACLVHAVTVSGDNRILRVLLNTHTDDRDLMGSIGHELRHAVEVLDDRTVTTDRAIYFLYKRVGMRSGNGFETSASISAGDAVRAEVRRSQVRPKAH